MRCFAGVLSLSVVFLMSACGGGGGGSGGGNPAPSSRSSQVSVSSASSISTLELSVGGSVSGLAGSLSLAFDFGDQPELLVITRNGSFAFEQTLTGGENYEVSVVSQPAAQTCQLVNGFGRTGSVDISNIGVICSANIATASVSGTITATAGITFDTTLNDRLADFVDNSSPLSPQPISNRATLHGFASAEGTGGDAQEERYGTDTNEDDYYRVSLQAGQVIQLQVVDFEGFNVGSTYEGDLDLYLINGDDIIGSIEVTEYEELVVPSDGEYLVNVYAYSGISKYVLRILPPGESGLSPGMTDGFNSAEFVPHQMVVQFEPSAAQEQKFQAQSANLMHFVHTDTDRPTLVSMEPQAIQLASAKGQKAKVSASRALEDLRQLNPVSYDKVVTLRNIKAMREQPGVRYAEPNYLRKTFRVPNDPGYSTQWHYNNISLPQAWDISTGARPSGQEVIVAVIDTGVYLDHPDFNGQLVAGYDFISNPASANDGSGIDANPDDPGDSDQRGQSSWHGTHVAGTIAAASNNNTGVAGVAWEAKIMPIRVLGKSGGTSYDVLQGVRYAAGLSNDSGTVPARRADIANLSLGGSGGSLAEQEAYQAARATGMIIVAAAGNDNSATPNYPAAYDGVISVSATDFANQRAPYSNFGSTISLAAPGGNIRADLNGDGYADGVLSALVNDTDGSRQAVYGFYQGTSMAAPHVAGVLALMKAVYPALTPDEVDMFIQQGAITDDLGTVGRDDLYGRGLINALKAVRVAADMEAGAPQPEWPPQIRATPTALNMGLTANASVTISNEGGGAPEVSSVLANRTWLNVTPGSISEAGLGGYQITVARGGLDDGFYQGQITFNFNGGLNPLAVAVNMQVGSVSSEGELTQLYVLLLDPETQESIAQTLPVRSGDNLNYSFSNIPAGEYTLIAGSDIDVDLFICQSGEACGAYPSLAQRQTISVNGVNLSGIDFVADILGNFSGLSSNSTGSEKAFANGVSRLPATEEKTPQGLLRQ